MILWDPSIHNELIYDICWVDHKLLVILLFFFKKNLFEKISATFSFLDYWIEYDLSLSS